MNDHTSLILVTHNQLEFTKLCLESIERHTSEPYELIVVDNGSTDGTVDFVKELGAGDWGLGQKRPEKLTIAANASNRGFPAAANQGIRAASGRQVLLLNNDTIVTDGWLRRMLRAFNSERGKGDGFNLPERPGGCCAQIEPVPFFPIGMVGPVSNFVSGPQQIAASYQGSGFGVQCAEKLDTDGLEDFARTWGEANEGRVVETERLVGFCLLIRREVIDRVGLFDERFGIGNFEDDDYCRRAREAGFRLAIAADAFVHHFGGRTFIGGGIDHGALMRRNERLFREKWGKSLIANRELLIEESDRRCAVNDQQFAISNQRLPLSLCLITRDNERTIGAALEVIRNYVDDIVVVDTGSKDGTPEIAASLGARVFHFPWCDDFSAARNESIRHALGEWIFWMDTDDVIDEENARKIRELVQVRDSSVQSAQSVVGSLGQGRSTTDFTDSADRGNGPPILGYLMKVRCPTAGANGDGGFVEVDQVKLFRNLPAIRFECRIHEQVLMAIRRAGGTVAWTDIFVVHANSDQSPAGRARKLERDLRILELERRERPDHPFTLFNLGMTLAEAGRFAEDRGQQSPPLEQEGTEETEKLDNSVSSVASCSNLPAEKKGTGPIDQNGPAGAAHQLDLSPFSLHEQAIGYLWQSIGRAGTDDSHLRKAYALLVSSYVRLGRDQTAMESCDRGLNQFPNDPELQFWLATLLHKFGRLLESAAAYERLLESPRERHLSSVDGAIAGHRARRNLVAVYVELGDLIHARCALDLAIRERPDDLSLLEQNCELLFAHFSPAEAETALRTLLERDADNASAHHNLGSILYKLGRYEESAQCFRRSLALRPDSSSTYLHLGYALQKNDDTESALVSFERAIALDPNNTVAESELRTLTTQAGGSS
jgi:GT2 family glycosyltransferase/tetratricopeptide (TPR) repeat protein